jgi:uncharacterized lipoprotein YddW (UPF0748 family)
LQPLRVHARSVALCLALALAPFAAPSRAEAPATAPVRHGLWVPCEGSVRVLDDGRRVPKLIADAHALGTTDLFVQVYRGGRSWFASSIADATPFRSARERGGADAFAALLDAAHANGIRVHAWINALSLSENRNATILARLGPDAVQVDRKGRSVLSYPDLEVPPPDRTWYRMGTRQVWIDPATPTVPATLAAIVAELVTAYPTLDGVHLDYIRHPDVLPFSPGSRFGVGLDFGYGAASRARFERETGLAAPFGDSVANADRWDDWRRERVTEIVQRIGAAARSAKPAIEVSAAVWAYADRGYLSIFQDWRGWLDARLVDFAVPMAYTTDDRMLRYLGASLVGGVGGDRVWLGLGSWLFTSDPARARTQRDSALAFRPAGISLFSYDAIVDSAPLRAALVQPSAAAP